MNKQSICQHHHCDHYGAAMAQRHSCHDVFSAVRHGSVRCPAMVWALTVAQLTGLQAVASACWGLKGLVLCTMASFAGCHSWVEDTCGRMAGQQWHEVLLHYHALNNSCIGSELIDKCILCGASFDFVRTMYTCV